MNKRQQRHISRSTQAEQTRKATEGARRLKKRRPQCRRWSDVCGSQLFEMKEECCHSYTQSIRSAKYYDQLIKDPPVEKSVKEKGQARMIVCVCLLVTTLDVLVDEALLRMVGRCTTGAYHIFHSCRPQLHMLSFCTFHLTAISDFIHNRLRKDPLACGCSRYILSSNRLIHRLLLTTSECIDHGRWQA